MRPPGYTPASVFSLECVEQARIHMCMRLWLSCLAYSSAAIEFHFTREERNLGRRGLKSDNAKYQKTKSFVLFGTYELLDRGIQDSFG